MHLLPTQTLARIATILLGVVELAVAAVIGVGGLVIVGLIGTTYFVLGTNGIAQGEPLGAVALVGCVAIVVCGLLWVHVLLKHTVEHSILAKRVFHGS